MLNNAACSKASAPYSIVKRGAFNTSGSGEEPGTRRVSTTAKVRAACGKNDANIEGMIADGGFDFHAKVKKKSQFLKPKEGERWYLRGTNASTVTDSQFSFAFLFVFILKSLSLPFTSL